MSFRAVTLMVVKSACLYRSTLHSHQAYFYVAEDLFTLILYLATTKF